MSSEVFLTAVLRLMEGWLNLVSRCEEGGGGGYTVHDRFGRFKILFSICRMVEGEN